MTPIIRRIDEHGVGQHLQSLTELLQDAVDSGASVGFLRPLTKPTARAYWQTVQRAVGADHRILLAAFEGDALVGSVQLDLAGMPNGSHRAEVMKLLVHRRARRRGIARALMGAIEESARGSGRQLLVLDTRVGDAAEQLYTKLGYSKAGIIPRYARRSTGELDATVFMYRWLD
ncbi:MAG: GNAT family N-acetyltransferase [Candidatus Rokuibacteriota bacterium]|nr:MAG: GNAT family N-acetyltransferase [Candidatus Rokubacteria bacterium]